jgi:hypothetical protein
MGGGLEGQKVTIRQQKTFFITLLLPNYKLCFIYEVFINSSRCLFVLFLGSDKIKLLLVVTNIFTLWLATNGKYFYGSCTKWKKRPAEFFTESDTESSNFLSSGNCAAEGGSFFERKEGFVQRHCR